MKEKDLDSSMNPYQEEQKPKDYIKQLQWDMASRTNFKRILHYKRKEY